MPGISFAFPRRALPLLVGVALSRQAFAAPLHLAGDPRETEITSHWDYAFEQGERPTFDEREKAMARLEWKPVPDGVSGFGTRTDALWMRLSLKSEVASRKAWSLCFRFAELDRVDFTYIDPNGSRFAHSTGIAIPFAEAFPRFPRPCLSFRPSQGESTIYARIESKGPLQISSTLFSPEGFESFRDRNDLVTAFFVSFMIVITLQSAIFAVAFRSIGFAAFMAHAAFCTLQVLALTGYVGYLVPTFPYLARIAKPFSGAAAFLSFFVLAEHFLELRVRPDRWSRLTKCLQLVSLAFIPVSLILHPFIDASQAIATFVAIVGIISVLAAKTRNRVVARLFLAGFSLFILSLIVEILTAFGIFPSNAFTEMVPHLGIMAEASFLALAITHYFSRVTQLISEKNGELVELNRTLEHEIEVRKTAEAQLVEERQRAIENARFKSAAEIAGNLTHEINTPLSIISFTTQNMLHGFPLERTESSHVRGELQKILKTIERTTTIVRNMRLLSRESGHEPPVSFSLRTLFDDAIGLFAQRLEKERIKVELHTPSPHLVVNAQQGAVFQIVTNLIKNSIDALTGADAPAERLIVLEGRKENKEVIISVSDNGAGIPPEYVEKVFEPFFTTKPGGSGHGLGLSISAKIAREHRGNLTLDPSSPSTRFVLRLPEI